jgi:hypothetical protein
MSTIASSVWVKNPPSPEFFWLELKGQSTFGTGFSALAQRTSYFFVYLIYIFRVPVMRDLAGLISLAAADAPTTTSNLSHTKIFSSALTPAIEVKAKAITSTALGAEDLVL